MLFRPGEAQLVRDVTWRLRRPVSGWLREVALEAAARLARAEVRHESGPVAGYEPEGGR